MRKPDNIKKIKLNITAIAILAICLLITTYALIYITNSKGCFFLNIFKVKLNVNDGKPIFEEHDFSFEPGKTIEKEFFIENQSLRDVYYRIYFDNIHGQLADIIIATIKNGEKILYSGKIKDLIRNSEPVTDDILKNGQRRYLTAYFYFPEIKMDVKQNYDLAFTLCAETI